jgi:hypothetical protein
MCKSEFESDKEDMLNIKANLNSLLTLCFVTVIFTESEFYLWLYSLLLDLGHVFSFLILYAVGRTPWMGDQPVTGPLPTHRINANRHHASSGI